MLIASTALTIKDLPLPPPGKSGWPWTEQSQPFPERMPDGSEWPRISVVTPSYNQGQFIEETIRSVLLQGYPNLEYIVIDGGSTDTSVEIIQKYAPWFSYWVSEKDRGQSDALNKGFHFSSGDICAYLNSDDIFFAGALSTIALFFIKKKFSWLASAVLYGESPSNSQVWKPHAATFPIFVTNQTVAQQGVFWAADIKQKPYFDWEKHFCMDHKFFTEIYLEYGSPLTINEVTAFFRFHPNSKSSNMLDVAESEKLSLISELSKKIDFSTALNLKKELYRRELMAKVSELLSSNSSSAVKNWVSVVEVAKILAVAPFPLRDRIFVSAMLHLCLRFFVHLNPLKLTG